MPLFAFAVGREALSREASKTAPFDYVQGRLRVYWKVISSLTPE